MQQRPREALDMPAYMDFHISVLAHRRISEWMPIVQAFVQSQLIPRLAPDALATLASHRRAGDCVALVTATNSILVGVLGQVMGIHTIASEIEVVDDRTTGRTLGLPSFREHKIARVEQWIGQPIKSESIEASHFYSDSSNDIPLLQAVSHPVAVNADPRLSALAKKNGWMQQCWKAEGESNNIA